MVMLVLLVTVACAIIPRARSGKRWERQCLLATGRDAIVFRSKPSCFVMEDSYWIAAIKESYLSYVNIVSGNVVKK